jgi:hypothetical protein
MARYLIASEMVGLAKPILESFPDLSSQLGFDLSQIEKPDPFRDILKRAYRVVDRMRRCGNPKCPAPFFLAARSSQVYCTAACAGPAHQAAKNKWWHDHGSAWLRKRRSKARRHSTKSRRKGGK